MVRRGASERQTRRASVSTMNFPPTKASLKAFSLLLSAALLAGACGSDPQTAEPSTDAPVATDAPDGSAAPTEESSAPAEEAQSGSTEVLATISGGQIDFGALEGQDALLWFWAPW